MPVCYNTLVCVCVRERELSKQLPDLTMDVAQEVHIRRPSVKTLILHQVLTEQHLRSVLLLHYQQLHTNTHQLHC